MRHFVAYHKPENWGGRRLKDGNPFNVFSKRDASFLKGNCVWFVEGIGKAPKDFFLGSVYIVDEVRPSMEPGYKHSASGNRGHVFQPPTPLNDLEWFGEFKEFMGRFGRGIPELPEGRYLDELKRAAAGVGFITE